MGNNTEEKLHLGVSERTKWLIQSSKTQQGCSFHILNHSPLMFTFPHFRRHSKRIDGVHSALVRVNEELLERKVAAPV
jgi:hypothetical protein